MLLFRQNVRHRSVCMQCQLEDAVLDRTDGLRLTALPAGVPKLPGDLVDPDAMGLHGCAACVIFIWQGLSEATIAEGKWLLIPPAGVPWPIEVWGGSGGQSPATICLGDCHC